MAFHWTCAYCDRDTTITDTYQTSTFQLTVETSVGLRYFRTTLIVCPNLKCKKFTLHIVMHKYGIQDGSGRLATNCSPGT
jgi:hypothetical protein